MNKVKGSLLTLLMVGAASLASCGGGGPEKGDVNLKFWSSFGSAYTGVLDGIVKQAAEKASDENAKVVIEHISQGSYDKVKSEMVSAIADRSYPNMVTGYPDHFAEYLGNYILQPLDNLVKSYDQKYGTDLLKDYLPQYMEENYSLDCDEDGNPVLSALPFNKSTELMGYNGVFVDYCASLDAYKAYELDKVPATWQEWSTKGQYYRDILTSLAGTGKSDGLAVYGVQNYEGTASNFAVHKRDEAKDADGNYIEAGSTGRKLLLDFTDVDNELTRVISWDSTDNMFITLIKQWGAEYTKLPAEEKEKTPLYRRGDILFCSSENKQKVIDCLKFFKEMNARHIFGVPKESQQSYNSKSFETNQVMFMLCSSGGLSYNTAKWENRFRVKPLPYYDDGVTQRKYVISQGANITLTDATNDFEKSFEAMVAMTTGELQAEWCLQTGYYPCSKSATETDKYQNFLKEATEEGITKYMEESGCTREEALAHAYETPTRVAYREGSNINETEYMVSTKEWKKFVDDAFIGSSDIRTLVKRVFESTFIKLVIDPKGEKAGSYKSVADIPDSVYAGILEDVVTDPVIQQKATNIRVVR